MSRITLQDDGGAVKVRPFRMLIYGAPGIGKSTFTATMPSPLTIDATGGTDRIAIRRLRLPDDGLKWSDLRELVDLLRLENCNVDTLVFDDIGHLEQLAFAEVCRQAKVETIDKVGWQNGYVRAVDLWRELLSNLERMQLAKNINVCMVAHDRVAKFKNPDGVDYGQIVPDVDHRLNAQLLRWCDTVLYARPEVNIVQSEGRAKAVDGGRTIVETSGSGAFVAKNRYNLPERIELKWSVIRDEMDRNTALMANASELLAGVDDDIRARAVYGLATQNEAAVKWIQDRAKEEKNE